MFVTSASSDFPLMQQFTKISWNISYNASRPNNFFGDSEIFQQDYAPAYSEKSTQAWRENYRVQELDWPANPDLNLVENLWGIMKKLNKQPPNI